jgi:hypothetical protein
VPALEHVAGVRVVARADALDGARCDGDDAVVLRIAPDEALWLGATRVDVEDPDAIVVPEFGFSMARLDAAELDAVMAHADWPLGDAPVAQGKIAGVPVKLLVGDPTHLVVQTAYADELTRRLGW